MNLEQGRRHIVVGVDGSGASLAALRWAGREAGLRGVGLRVVRAWENQMHRMAPYALHARLLDDSEDRLAASGRLNEAVGAALESEPGAEVTVEVAEGLAARVLLDRAAGAELLVLGITAAPGTGVVGPVAQACLRHAPCPVVVVGA